MLVSEDMPPHRIEQERPAEWLRWLAENVDGYRLLLEESGGLARAAYRLARARCHARGGIGATPTLRELQIAALALARELGMSEGLPVSAMLVSDCQAQGLPVIEPLPAPLRPTG